MADIPDQTTPNQPPEAAPQPQPIEALSPGIRIKSRFFTKKRLLIILSSILVLFGVLGGLLWWYQALLKPAQPDSSQLVPVVIEPGSTTDSIGQDLANKQIIRSKFAFTLYIQLHDVHDKLQAGTYRLSPADSTPEIINHLTNGNIDTFRLTFYPGATLVDATNTPESQKTDVTTVLRRAGYSDDEISAALSKQYDHPVFTTKPPSADLEGYIYGETYEFTSGASVEDILTRTFDELYAVIQDNDLVAAYKKQGLSLYEGITLASIIQREVSAKQDQRQVAQVFLLRLSQGMQLGSDVTYQYIADKTGVDRDPNLDSPYNTRQYDGLPPGPISSPGLGSLLAVANPADGDYLYFLSGDDDITYFAHSLAEHQQNIIEHCQQKCSEL